MLTLFAWPSSRLEPRDLPIGVAGAPAAVQPLEQQLGGQEGAFDLHRYASEAEARRAIEDREVYGAFVAAPGGVTVLTSSAGSPAVAQLLTHAAAEHDAEVEDVVTTTPAASGLGSSVLPLVLAGIVTGVLAALAGVARQRPRRAHARRLRARRALGGADRDLARDRRGRLARERGRHSRSPFLAIAGGRWWASTRLLGRAGLGIGAL